MIADFLDTMQPKVKDYVSDEELPTILDLIKENEQEETAYQHLIPNFNQSTTTFPHKEEDILYYIADYTIGSVTKLHNIGCERCLEAVKSQDPRWFD